MKQLKFLVVTVLFFIFSYQTAFAVVVPARQEEKPQGASCYMQEKVYDGLWRCFTEDQWNAKIKSEREEQIKKSIEHENYANSSNGRLHFWGTWASLIIGILLMSILESEVFAGIFIVVWCLSWILYFS